MRPSRKSQAATLKAAADSLRVLCPTHYPVKVRRVDMAPAAFGDAELLGSGNAKHFLIRINKNKDVDFQIWVLVHEWAHCMAWLAYHDRHVDHCPHFGIAYSEAYLAVYGEHS